MPFNRTLEVKHFDCWNIELMGPFSPPYSNLHILLCVDYVIKWFRATMCLADDATIVFKWGKVFLQQTFGEFPGKVQCEE